MNRYFPELDGVNRPVVFTFRSVFSPDPLVETEWYSYNSLVQFLWLVSSDETAQLEFTHDQKVWGFFQGSKRNERLVLCRFQSVLLLIVTCLFLVTYRSSRTGWMFRIVSTRGSSRFRHGSIQYICSDHSTGMTKIYIRLAYDKATCNRLPALVTDAHCRHDKIQAHWPYICRTARE